MGASPRCAPSRSAVSLLRRRSECGYVYQYANRLAYQFFLTRQNALHSSLVFLYFTNATDVDGPSSEDEWRGATRLIHAILGLPPDLTGYGVYDAYVDAKHLSDSER